jgi:hypothetical protein
LRLLVDVMVGLRLGSEWHPKAGEGWNAGTIINPHRDVAMSVRRRSHLFHAATGAGG